MTEVSGKVLKEPHPGRVAGGKKLAEFNRKRKEEMLKLVQVSTQVVDQVPTQVLEQVPNKELVSSFNLYSAGVIILLIGGGVVGYMFYTSKNSKTPATEVKLSKPTVRRKML